MVGADAIAGRAYHVGNGKVGIVAENIQDFADAMGTIAEEGRHIYHRNNNGLEDSEDYASFYGRQFERYFNKRAKDTPLYMIGSNLAYNAGQLGNDWENSYVFISIQGGGGAGFLINGKLVGSVGISIDDKSNKVFFASLTGSAGLGFGASGGLGMAVGYNPDPKKNAKSVLGLMGGAGAAITGVALSGGFDVDLAGTIIGNIGAGTKYGWQGSVDANLGYTWEISRETFYKILKFFNISSSNIDKVEKDMIKRMK